MLDLIREAMAANQADAATYSQGVRIWMAVMSIAFLSSVIFAPWKAGARWILAATLVNILGLILIKAFFPAFSRTMIGTSVHLIFWTPVLWSFRFDLSRLVLSCECHYGNLACP